MSPSFHDNGINKAINKATHVTQFLSKSHEQFNGIG